MVQTTFALESVTAHEAKLYRIIRDAQDGWIDRAGIAVSLNKQYLNMYDLFTLHLLLERGLIETRKAETHSPLWSEWQYRAIDGKC